MVGSSSLVCLEPLFFVLNLSLELPHQSIGSLHLSPLAVVVVYPANRLQDKIEKVCRPLFCFSPFFFFFFFFFFFEERKLVRVTNGKISSSYIRLDKISSYIRSM